MTETLQPNRIYVIGHGIVACSVCVPNGMNADAIEAYVNSENPTGISSAWSISDEDFAEEQPNPCPCDQFPESRSHYLLNC